MTGPGEAVREQFREALGVFDQLVSRKQGWASWIAALALPAGRDPRDAARAIQKLRRCPRSRGGVRNVLALPLAASVSDGVAVEDRAAAAMAWRVGMRAGGGGSGPVAMVGAWCALAATAGDPDDAWIQRVAEARTALRGGPATFRPFLGLPLLHPALVRVTEGRALLEQAGGWAVGLRTIGSFEPTTLSEIALWLALREGAPDGESLEALGALRDRLGEGLPAPARAIAPELAALIFRRGRENERLEAWRGLDEAARDWPARPRAPLDLELLALLAALEDEGEAVRPFVLAIAMRRLAQAEAGRREALIALALAVIAALAWSASRS